MPTDSLADVVTVSETPDFSIHLNSSRLELSGRMQESRYRRSAAYCYFAILPSSERQQTDQKLQ